METTREQIRAELWTEGLADHHEGTRCEVEVERDEYGTVSMYTFIDGRGSKVSYVLDREAAILVARDLLQAAAWR